MTALAVSENDPVAPAKILSEYAEKIESFSIKGGFMDGAIISVEDVNAIAKVPSKETMLCKIMGQHEKPALQLSLCAAGNYRPRRTGGRASAG